MMKNNNILYAIVILLFISSCSDDMLDKLPVDSLVEETAFTSNQSFETFSWGFYTTFNGYNLVPQNEERSGDLISYSFGNQGNQWLWQRVTVPTASSNWNNPYKQIRRANIMLRNTNKDVLTDVESRHWKSIALFFRAYEYIKLVTRYGEVPWLGDEVLTDQSAALYGARTPRDELTENILNDLLFAEQNISKEGKNTIDVDVVRALISRFGLFEGTWRKYHGLGNETKYLQASVKASTMLIQDNPTLIDKYDLVFNSADLNGKSGILLYKQYEVGELTHILTSRHRNSAGWWDLTKKAVDKYLCTDGQTRWTSPLFDGEQDPYDEFRNRDRRLYTTTTVPFQVTTGLNGQNPNRSTQWNYDNTNPKYREYLDFMSTFSDADHKAGPTSNWNGFIVKQEPHYRNFNNGQGFNVSYTGYKLHKYYNNLNTGVQNQDFADAPIFRMGEVLVNHAEASFELGQFTQAVANVTINKLRERGKVAALNIGSITPDPTRDPDVDPVLWEIRRERAVELMAEGFRPNDIRRWKKFVTYGGEEKLGRWVNNANFGNKLSIQGGANKGYISPFGVPPGVPEYYYLAPIPSNQIVLNPNLVQNPGWN